MLKDKSDHLTIYFPEAPKVMVRVDGQLYVYPTTVRNKQCRPEYYVN
jgi:hypothetical protein